jgi:Ni,Fe-hydrogenase III small subunit/ferredoxin
MSNWILRGLRQGILTTPYPFGPAQMEERYRGRVAANPDASPDALERGSSACLSAAIREHGSARAVDTERCFQCGECARVAPEAFVFSSDFELALVEDDIEEARERLALRAAAFGRSIHLRHVDCGSDGSCEQELQAIFNPFYDVNRLGIFMTATPRHADILVATGIVTPAMVEPLRRVYGAMPEPKIVVALGSAACSGTIYGAGGGPVERFVPVDVKIPGTPPAPLTIIHGLWVALGRIRGGLGGVA